MKRGGEGKSGLAFKKGTSKSVSLRNRDQASSKRRFGKKRIKIRKGFLRENWGGIEGGDMR